MQRPPRGDDSKAIACGTILAGHMWKPPTHLSPRHALVGLLYPRLARGGSFPGACDGIRSNGEILSSPGYLQGIKEIEKPRGAGTGKEVRSLMNRCERKKERAGNALVLELNRVWCAEMHTLRHSSMYTLVLYISRWDVSVLLLT